MKCEICSAARPRRAVACPLCSAKVGPSRERCLPRRNWAGVHLSDRYGSGSGFLTSVPGLVVGSRWDGEDTGPIRRLTYARAPGAAILRHEKSCPLDRPYSRLLRPIDSERRPGLRGPRRRRLYMSTLLQ